MHRWWIDQPEEHYWLEITDRDDLGVDLNAPQTRDGSDAPHWSYDLINEIDDGDIVLHFHKPAEAIVAWSRASGGVWVDEVVWGALPQSWNRRSEIP
jgi:hypothetical protein